jgi:CRP-like cAMP-binding protein
VPVTEAMRLDLALLFSPLQLRKDEYLAVEGRVENQITFINTGVLRAFFRGADGKEYNKTFFDTPVFVGAYNSLITGNTNIINIQALTNCSLLAADYKKLLALYDKHPQLERLARILAETFFVVKEKREIELVTLDAA